MSTVAQQAGASPGRVAAARFLDPVVLARIGNLDLVARGVVDGFISGLHRARNLGMSTDFAEHLSPPGTQVVATDREEDVGTTSTSDSNTSGFDARSPRRSKRRRST